MFVGARHIEVVDALEQSFQRTVVGFDSRLVVISAPTGFGKSRIVQEFYARIAASQSVPAYWPARIATDGLLNWRDSRKCMFPSNFAVTDGAQLPWFWWGVSCGKRQDGRQAQALFDAVPQLAAHAEGIYDRLQVPELAGRSFDWTSALIGVLGLFGVAFGGPVVAGALTIAGAGRTLWQNKDFLDKLGDRRAKREMRANGNPLDVEFHGRGTQMKELAANIVTVSRKVPVVFVIDDAHWADSTLIEFIDEVLQNPQARILIVATTWPIITCDTQTGAFSNWLRAALLAEPNARHIEVKTLEGLGKQDLAELVRAEYEVVAPLDAPPLSEAVIAGVLDRAGVTPMGVRALFGLERTRRLIADGSLTLREMGGLPRDLEDALRLYWDDVPKKVQTVLAMAALAGFRFLCTPIVAAATAQGINDAGERLTQGEDPYNFIRTLDAGLAMFVDPIFHDTAHRAAEDTFTNAQREAIQQAIIEYALSVSLADQSPGVCELAWATHIRLASEGFKCTSAVSSAVKLAELSARRFDYLAAIDMTRHALDFTPRPADDVHSLNIRHNLAHWLRLAGKLNEAVQTARCLLDVMLVMPKSHDRDARLAKAHLELALSLKQQEKFDAALEESGKAARLLDGFADSDESTISLRRFVQRTEAACLGERPETVGQAIELLEALLADKKSPTIPDDEAMQIRHDLGSHYGGVGEYRAKAVEVFKELRNDRERLLGVDDPATLETTHSLASLLAASGPEFLSQSLELFTRVAEGRDRVLGPQNPETLRTRHSIAWVNAELGDVETAFRQYESLLNDRRRFLGQDHPDTEKSKVSLEHLRSRTCEKAARTFLVADALKPEEGETFAELRIRFDQTALSAWNGADALALLAECDPVRAGRYRTLTWRTRQLPLCDLRVWPGMGGLPDSWCGGSVVETANHLRQEGVPEAATRLKGLLSLISDIAHDELVKWLTRLPLIAVAETSLHNRPYHPTAIWTLDDGSHRAIVLNLLGVESVAVLVGEPF